MDGGPYYFMVWHQDDDSSGSVWHHQCPQKEEIFKIDPGKMVQLSRWTRPPVPLQLGTYQVAFNYENVPELDWTDYSIGERDWFALRRLRNSTPFKGTSNTVKIVVVDPSKQN